MSTMPNMRRRVTPLAERERRQHEVDLEEADLAGESPEIPRNLKKHLTDPKIGKALVNERDYERKKKILKAGTPQPLSKAERILLEKRKEHLVEWLRPRMVPVEDASLRSSNNGTHNPDYGKAVSVMAKNEMQNPEYQEKAYELKNILRTLDPDDPQAGNLERFRPRRGESGAA